MPRQTARAKDKDPVFHLRRFFPYRISRFYAAVSKSLAYRYRDELGLSVPEWRTLAVLGSEGSKSASQVGMDTDMDKVQVSRAVTRLKQKGMISRGTDPQDRRRSVLELTDKGREAYNMVVPRALAYEQEMLEVLSPEEEREFWRLVEKLQTRAQELKKAGN